MSRETQKHEWIGPIFFSLVIMLPVLYVLSIGPMVWLADHGLVDGEKGWAVAFYFPLGWLAENCQPLGAFVEQYMSLFEEGIVTP